MIELLYGQILADVMLTFLLISVLVKGPTI